MPCLPPPSVSADPPHHSPCSPRSGSSAYSPQMPSRSAFIRNNYICAASKATRAPTPSPSACGCAPSPAALARAPLLLLGARTGQRDCAAGGGPRPHGLLINDKVSEAETGSRRDGGEQRTLQDHLHCAGPRWVGPFILLLSRIFYEMPPRWTNSCQAGFTEIQDKPDLGLIG